MPNVHRRRILRYSRRSRANLPAAALPVGSRLTGETDSYRQNFLVDKNGRSRAAAPLVVRRRMSPEPSPAAGRSDATRSGPDRFRSSDGSCSNCRARRIAANRRQTLLPHNCSVRRPVRACLALRRARPPESRNGTRQRSARYGRTADCLRKRGADSPLLADLKTDSCRAPATQVRRFDTSWRWSAARASLG